MAKPRVDAGGGFPALTYSLKMAKQAGGIATLYSRMRSRNTCKTCALGMGGQKGGMTNEREHFPEVCKKSFQAQAADMAGIIDEDFFRNTPIAELARYTSYEFEKLGRLTFPVVAEATDTHFRRITWDEALNTVTQKLTATSPERTFFYASGRSSNEAAFLYQLVARAYGTRNIHNCSFYCHAASSVVLQQTYSSGTASVVIEDLDHADVAIIAGANPASNHPRLMSSLLQLRRRGGHVIVINPLKELGLVKFRVPSDWKSLLFGSDIASLYLQPHIGGDIALLKALLKGLVEKNAIDSEFIATHTVGWDAVRSDLESSSWELLVAASGVDRREIDRAIEILTSSRRGIAIWAMGLTHHVWGVDNVQALTNLALAKGWIGKPGCGLLPLRGHSNVQGVGSVGVSPEIKEAFAQKLEALYGITIPREPGQDTYASMVAAKEKSIDVAILLGGNLYGSNPDSQWSEAALRTIPFTFSITTKLNEGHVRGRGQTTIIVPALARDEESQATTQESMFNYVRLSEGGTPNVIGEMRSEVDIIASIAERILPNRTFDWSTLHSHRALRHAIAHTVTGYAPLVHIDDRKEEFQIEGRTFHERAQLAGDRRARFHLAALPPLENPEPGSIRLMTIRSEGQFNTVVYDQEDLYRGVTHRNVILMSAMDARSIGVSEGDLVTVETDAGSLTVTVVIVDIAPGNAAMYYPEANRIVPRKLDSRSKTPAFKSVIARVIKNNFPS